MKPNSKKLRIILLIAALFVVLGGGLTAAYHFDLAPGFFKLIPGLNEKYKEKADGSDDKGSSIAYKESLTVSEEKVATLLKTGNAESQKEADKIVESEVTAANKSENDDYIVYANLAKAKLLMDTSRYQEAIDNVLLPLLQKYGTNEKYKGDINIALSIAYTKLGDGEKANEYLGETTGRGGE